MARMTLEEKVGQLFIQNVYGSDATTPDARNIPLYGWPPRPRWCRSTTSAASSTSPGPTASRTPTRSPGLSNGLQRASLGQDSKVHVPLQIAIDQEQGVVTRIGPPATQFPGSMALGAGRSTDDARTAAAITGQELKAMGVNTNFAPDSDVNVNALNPVIGTRSFSSDPSLAAQMVGAQVSGYQDDAGISSAAKHFPGHGDTATDSHVAFPVITHTREQWEQLDAPPFQGRHRQGHRHDHDGAPGLPGPGRLRRPGHAQQADPDRRPARAARLQGVIVTDSLGMQGVRDRYGDAEVAIRALEAGPTSCS